MALTRQQLFHFARLLSVEPLAFLLLFIFLFKKLAIDQLIQDKICIQRHGLPVGYCFYLPSMLEVEDNFRLKSTILGDVTSFQMYINICLALPVFLLSLLVGPFIDKYPPAKKMLLIFSGIVLMLDSTSYLINSFWFNLDYRFLIISSTIGSLTAGPMIGMTCSWSYLSAVTPSHIRSTRLMIMEVVVSAAPPLAIALGGNLLDLAPLFPRYEPRNYSTIFLVSILGSAIYLGLAVYLLDEAKDKARFTEHFPRQEHHRISFKMKEETETASKKLEESSSSPWSILFDLRNTKEMFVIFTKSRPFHIRSQLILLVVGKLLIHFATFGTHIFLYQYVQKVFHWSASEYSNYLSFSQVINILSTFTAGSIIINIFKISDLYYSLLGSGMTLIQNVLRLCGTSVWTFYAALPFYGINSLATVGIQAYITKITERGEVGRIFSLMGVLDSLLPMFASVIYVNIFRLTIDSRPNLAFLAVVIGLIGGMGCCGWVVGRWGGTLEVIEGRGRKGEAEETEEEMERL